MTICLLCTVAMLPRLRDFHRSTPVRDGCETFRKLANHPADFCEREYAQREWRGWWCSSASVNKYDSELYYARRSPSRAVTRVGIAAAATREPISMVISRRPIIEYAKYVYARQRAASPFLFLCLSLSRQRRANQLAT